MKKSSYYVYELAYPGSMGASVFYVGKGKDSRIYAHEYEARTGGVSRKCDTIRSIWANGEQIVKRKVFETDVEQDAYIYEWGLINLIHGRDRLTNFCEGKNNGEVIASKSIVIHLPRPLLEAVNMVSQTTSATYIRSALSLGLKSESVGKSLLEQGKRLLLEVRKYSKASFSFHLSPDLLDEMEEIGVHELRQDIIEHFLCCDPMIVAALGDEAQKIREEPRKFFTSELNPLKNA